MSHASQRLRANHPGESSLRCSVSFWSPPLAPCRSRTLTPTAPRTTLIALSAPQLTSPFIMFLLRSPHQRPLSSPCWKPSAFHPPQRTLHLRTLHSSPARRLTVFPSRTSSKRTRQPNRGNSCTRLYGAASLLHSYFSPRSPHCFLWPRLAPKRRLPHSAVRACPARVQSAGNAGTISGTVTDPQERSLPMPLSPSPTLSAVSRAPPPPTTPARTPSPTSLSTPTASPSPPRPWPGHADRRRTILRADRPQHYNADRLRKHRRQRHHHQWRPGRS